MSRFKIEDGDIKIGLDELVDALSETDRRTLSRQLVADEQLFKAVLECVADPSSSGYGHYFNDEEDAPWWFSNRTVLEMREKLIPLMPEVARLAVQEALKQRDAAVDEKERMSQWAWRMFHAWPDCSVRGRPELPSPSYGSPNCKTCGADVRAVKAQCRELTTPPDGGRSE